MSRNRTLDSPGLAPLLEARPGKKRLQRRSSAIMIDFVVNAGFNALSSNSASFPFVGRSVQLRRCDTLLGAAARGRGSVVVVSGDHGVGKSRFVRHLASRAAERGFLPIWGHCDEDSGAPVYHPWANIIRKYLEASGAERTMEVMGASAGDIAEIAPAIRRALPELSMPVEIGQSQGQYRLIDSILGFLTRAAECDPLLIVLDNLHNSDRGSLRLLESVARDIETKRILIAVTYVEGPWAEGLEETLGELARLPFTHSLQLENLSRRSCEMFIEASLGRGGSLARSLYRITRGHPLFLTEIVRYYQDRLPIRLQELEGRGIEDTPLNFRIRSVLSRRLNRLPKECQGALTVAAVVGGTFDTTALASLLHTEADRIERCLQFAVSDGLLRIQGPASYRFSHDLIQAAIATRMSTDERARIHLSLARALEGEAGVGAAQIAYHYANAGREGITGLARFAVEAGREALARYAHQDAARFFEEAIGALKDTGDELGQARARHSLARALVPLGRQAHAVEEIVEAFRILRSNGAEDEAARVAEFPWFPDDAVLTKALAPIREEALRLVEPSSLRAASLRCQLGLVYGLESYEKAIAMYRDVAIVARRLSDSRLEVLALCFNTYLEAVRGNPAYWSTRSGAFERVRQLGDPYAESWMRGWLGFAELALGNVAVAKEHSETIAFLAHEMRSRKRSVESLGLAAALAQAEGHWQQCRELVRRGLSLQGNDLFLLASGTLLEAETGDFGEARSYFDEFLAAVRRAPEDGGFRDALAALVVPIYAHLTSTEPRWGASELGVERLLSQPSYRLYRAHALIARSIRHLESSGNVNLQGAYDEVRAITPLYTPWGHAHWDRLRAMLARRIDGSEELECLLSSYRFCKKAGYEPEYARTCLDLALCLKDEPEKSAAYLCEAREIAGRLSMAALAREIEEHFPDSDGARSGAVPDGLTPREIEVIRLVAVGMASKEIAAELNISYHTVTNHLRNAFEKTGVQSRTELGRYAAVRGILPLDRPQT